MARCPSVCLSRADVLSKSLNAPSRNERRMVGYGLRFSGAKDLDDIRRNGVENVAMLDRSLDMS